MGMKKYEALLSKVFYFLLSTTILAMLGVFSFISSTIPLPKTHTSLFATAYDLVVMARSTKMLVFILFHIIIVMICYGSSSKPSFDSEVDSDEFLVVTHKANDVEKTEEVEACAYGDKCDEDDGETDSKTRPQVKKGGYEDIDDMLYEGDDESYDSDDDEEGCGDLRGRIEEFIGSVTKTWKEELLKEKKLLCLVEDTESLYMLVPYEMV